ncbi:hypothetical protein F5B21DRAFT_288358 [Xylaria acuta]|nr:hypothetical protein F5B21DRAFT_288358 [Xylaria acuta]
MVSMQFRLLALLSLAARVARSNNVNLLNDIPVDTIMDEGTTFVLKWEWDGDATGVGILDMASFKIGDVDSSMTYQLEDKLNLTMGRYPWVVKPPKGRATLDWYCSLGISYNDGFQSISGRSFRIKASPSPSTTSATRTATSTTSSTRSTGTETNSFDQQMPGESSSSSSNNKLPPGSLAGIIVGAILGGVVVVTAISLVAYYRGKAAREKMDSTTTSSEAGSKGGADTQTGRPGAGAVEAQYYLKPELEATTGAERVYYELDSRHLIQEVDASSKPTELDSNARSELSGDSRGEPR